MRFIIHGAGALGSLVGGRLAANGAEVVLVGRDPHIDAIVRNGLTLHLSSSDSPRKDLLVRNLGALTGLDAITPRPDDLLLLSVKSSATIAAIQQLRDKFDETTPIFCLQNGVRNEELAARRFLNVHGIMAGLVARLIGPGEVTQLAFNELAVGAYPRGASAKGLALAAALGEAGFKVTTPESIMAVKWSKLLLNLNNATLAIIDCHLQLAMAIPEIAGFMVEVIEEGRRVLEAAGISFGDPPRPDQLQRHLAVLRREVAPPEVIAALEQLPPAERAYPSTWVDLHERRGETEAGFLNGEIIRLGEKYGLLTPFNSTLLNVVESMAAARIPPGRHTLPELLRLVAADRPLSTESP